MFTVIILVLIFGALVLVHEWGHFIAARKLGVKVDEFGFGFPPRLFGFKYKGTLYSINLLPLGGFVKLHGEEGQDNKSPQSFSNQKVWKRITIVIAGVVMNFFLALLLFIALNAIGTPVSSFGGETKQAGEIVVEPYAVKVGSVTKDSPAAKGGLEAGDTIVSVNGITITDGKQLHDISCDVAGKGVGVSYVRGKVMQAVNIGTTFPEIVVGSVPSGSELKAGDVIRTIDGKKFKTVDPLDLASELCKKDNFYTYQQQLGDLPATVEVERTTKSGLFGKNNSTQLLTVASPLKGLEVDQLRGAIGIAPIESKIVRFPVGQAIIKGVSDTFETVAATFLAFGALFKTLFTTGQAPAGVSGPVGIAQIVGQLSRFGYQYLILLTAALSVNLMIFNFLPIPALDGGKLVFLYLEGIFRKKVVKEKIENTIHIIGFIALILLILLVTYFDIAKLF